MKRKFFTSLSVVALLLVGLIFVAPRSLDEATLVRSLVPELEEVAHAEKDGASEAAFVGRTQPMDLAKRIERFLARRPGWVLTTHYNEGTAPLLIASYSPAASPRWWTSLPLLDRIRFSDNRPFLTLFFYDGCFSRDDLPFNAKGRWATLCLSSYTKDYKPEESGPIKGWSIRRPK